MPEKKEHSCDYNQIEIELAEAEIIQAEAVKLLLSNNTLTAEIRISGMVIRISDNKWLIPVINNEINEIRKSLKGDQNM